MKHAFLFFFMAITLWAQTDPHPSVRLNWLWSQGTGDPATGFHVYRSTTSGTYSPTPLATVPTGTLTYLDTTIAVGQTYYYVITAYNPIGESARTNEVSCVSPFQSAPNAPTGLSGTGK